MRRAKAFVACAFYGAGNILTYAYVWQHSNLDEAIRFSASVVAGIFWPIYWAGRIAFVMTENWSF